MTTINIFMSCNENIQRFTSASHLWKYYVFITLDENIYSIHSKRVISSFNKLT